MSPAQKHRSRSSFIPISVGGIMFHCARQAVIILVIAYAIPVIACQLPTLLQPHLSRTTHLIGQRIQCWVRRCLQLRRERVKLGGKLLSSQDKDTTTFHNQEKVAAEYSALAC